MLYVVNHTEQKLGLSKDRKEIKVGKFGSGGINNLNPYLSELTGLYDIWKNTKDEIVGLEHYRRKFNISEEEAKEILKDYDIILVEDYITPECLLDSLKYQFRNDLEDFMKWYKIVENTLPIKEYMRSNVFNPKLMFITKRETLNDYCEWLFNWLLPITENFVKYTHKDNRLLGYIVERLLTYYCKENGLKIYKCSYTGAS